MMREMWIISTGCEGLSLNDFVQIDAQIDEWVEGHREEIIAKTQEILRIPSVLGDAQPGAPFGREPLRALEFVRDLCHGYGLTTKIIDGYAMHAEAGQGELLIGVLSHVDVVPAGEDWTYDPFGATIADGKIFGRGAIDDKGPAIASLYAIFAVKQLGLPLTSRIRAILGADEETGFRCVDYYFAHEEMPTIGFTPDGSFPAIYAEKGIASFTLESALPVKDIDVTIAEFSAGARGNMVPDRATVRLRGAGVDWVAVAALMAGERIVVEPQDDGVVVRAFGVSAHASYPHEGINAVALVIRALLRSGVMGGLSAWLEMLLSFASDNTGAPLGLAAVDKVTGPLTSNLGVVVLQEGKLRATFSVRYPVDWKGEAVRQTIIEKASLVGYELVQFSDSPPLYVPQDDPLVATLLNVYRDVTGDQSPPKTMGGGTYARSLKKGIAFGPNFPGFPDVAHKADEFWYIDELILATRIYARALARLAA